MVAILIVSTWLTRESIFHTHYVIDPQYPNRCRLLRMRCDYGRLKKRMLWHLQFHPQSWLLGVAQKILTHDGSGDCFAI